MLINQLGVDPPSFWDVSRTDMEGVLEEKKGKGKRVEGT